MQRLFPEDIRKIIFLILFFFALTTRAQNLDKTVVPISKLRILGPMIENVAGTGFCLDPDCRFIGTNYHVAAYLRFPLKIEGEQVIQEYLASGPDDQDATINLGLASNPLAYTVSRDLAIFELHRPLNRRGFHALSFSLDVPQIGDEVDIYAYPGTIVPVRQLSAFHGNFLGETTTGVLAFSYDSSEKKIKAGASGGIVVDRKTKRIVGVLQAVGIGQDSVALAVPIRSLADFLDKVQPNLHDQLFPVGVSLGHADLPEYFPSDLPEYVPSASSSLQARPEEPTEIKLLRQKAQALADSMRNFIAVQTFDWGMGDRNNSPFASAQYEVRVIDGRQWFREYPNGKKELQYVPGPVDSIVLIPGDAWSQLPKLIGTNLNLTLRHTQDIAANGRKILIFQYHGALEDNACGWKTIFDFIFFEHNQIINVACYGEVWTDENLNILRISQHYHLSAHGWTDYQALVTYGWLRKPGEEWKLIPTAIMTQADYKKKAYWCRGLFTDYHMFSTQVLLNGVAIKKTN